MLLVIEAEGAYDLNWEWLPFWVATDQEFRDQMRVVYGAAAENNPDTPVPEMLESLHALTKTALIERGRGSCIAELITALEAVDKGS